MPAQNVMKVSYLSVPLHNSSPFFQHSHISSKDEEEKWPSQCESTLLLSIDIDAPRTHK